jgi:SAM-dependent methyltransferase
MTISEFSGRRLVSLLSRHSPFGRIFLCAIVTAASLAGVGGAEEPRGTSPGPRAPDVRYEPSDMEAVQAMLRLADVKPSDVVYDLGCGDGRIVIAAARLYQARGVCVDIDPQRIAESRENARQAGVAHRIQFLSENLLITDITGATVVTLFLSAQLNLQVRPKLLRELKPGARVVSHWHDMGDWKPQQTIRVSIGGRGRSIYLWTIP